MDNNIVEYENNKYTQSYNMLRTKKGIHLNKLNFFLLLFRHISPDRFNLYELRIETVRDVRSWTEEASLTADTCRTSQSWVEILIFRRRA